MDDPQATSAHASAHAVSGTSPSGTSPSGTSPSGTSAGAQPCWDDDRLWERLVGNDSEFAGAWGRHPVRRRTHEDFATLFGIGDAEQLLATGLRRPAFRLVRDGVTLPDAMCTRPIRLGGRDLDDVADVERIASAFVAGATVVFQGLQRTHPRVGAFASALERTSGHPVHVNAYLTPPSEHGLAVHSDAHDVLVLHVSGEKQWSVDGLGDLVLGPGDVLYVPAGVDHEASSTHGATLHLTVGVHRVTMRQIIVRLLTEVGQLDHPAPLRFVGPDRSAFTTAVSTAIDAAVGGLSDLDPEQVSSQEIERAARRSERATPVSTCGVLTSAAGLPVLDDATPIALRAGCVLAADGEGHVRIERSGRSLRIPVVAAPALTHLLASGGCRVGEIPGLDGDSRLVLARRLVRELLATTGHRREHRIS